MLHYLHVSCFLVMRLYHSIDIDVSEVSNNETCSCELMKCQHDGMCSVMLRVITPK